MILNLLITLVTLPSSAGDDWPGWRGPHGAGVGNGSPPIEWSEEKNVRWKVAVPGKGSSSPIVVGDRVYLSTAVPTGRTAEPQQEGEEREAGERGERGEQGGDGSFALQERGGQGRGEQGRGQGRGGRGGQGRRAPAPLEEQEFVVLALDRADGSTVWKKTASVQMPHQGTHRDGNYASPTMVADEDVVIAYFGSFGVYAYTPKGELLWEKDLGDMNIRRSFGEGSSPALYGDSLVICFDNDDESFIVVLDKKSGKEVWRKERDLGTVWVSPIVVDSKRGPQVLCCSATTVSYALKDGEVLWTCDKAPAARGGGNDPGRGGGVISSPVYQNGVLVFSTGSRRGAFYAIHVDSAEGDLSESEAVLWSSEGDTPFVTSPIAYDGVVYSLKGNAGLLSAYHLDFGEKVYGPERMAGLADAYAAPVAADGRLYFVGRDGTAEVVAAGEEFKSLAVNKLDDRFDASPAIAGDELYLRGAEHLYCIARTE